MFLKKKKSDWTLIETLKHWRSWDLDFRYFLFQMKGGGEFIIEAKSVLNFVECDNGVWLSIYTGDNTPYLLKIQDIVSIRLIIREPENKRPSGRDGPGPTDPEIHKRVLGLKISTKSNPMLQETY